MKSQTNMHAVTIQQCQILHFNFDIGKNDEIEITTT